MRVSSALRHAVVALPVLMLAFSASAAQQWHFVVKNKTESNITKLQVSQDKSEWGNFDVGSGIAPGERATLVWGESTSNEKCKQWIRAKFADGSWSEPSKQDFCQDLDDPIEFGE